jgi:hypothetical protein
MSFKDIFEGHVVKTTISEIKELLSAIVEEHPDTKNLDKIIKLDNSLQYISGVINSANYYSRLVAVLITSIQICKMSRVICPNIKQIAPISLLIQFLQ